MASEFFDRPILNSPYAYPGQHWELDTGGQPTNRIIASRRRSELITPVPKPRRVRGRGQQREMLLDSGDGLSSEEQAYNPTPIINEIRQHVDTWRNLPHPDQWQVSPETARLLQHWRHHGFQGIRPFFCQVEAVETAIWLTEVAPKHPKALWRGSASRCVMAESRGTRCSRIPIFLTSPPPVSVAATERIRRSNPITREAC